MRDIGNLRAENSYFCGHQLCGVVTLIISVLFRWKNLVEYFQVSHNLWGLELPSQGYINTEFMWQKNMQQLHIINCSGKIIAEKRHSALVF